MADWAAMVEARDAEIARLRAALAESERLRGSLYEIFRNTYANEVDRTDRYRLAWLSARRRAAEEAAFGADAVEHYEAKIQQLRSTLGDSR
ncbi:hypothetical protein GCM10009548_02060 [Streptomyces malaysiensis subsp. malaysiensis]|uniref:Uncharacterized protein n=1 Tax=Streptomyces malaysiensis TaxID=92644 RepID=A0ABX6W6C9_STRMQ|nr:MULTISPECIES: hypothetical protein [Streptomyces]QPI56329.1 hypothetical protein I1A49_16520 [Streptomyces solisilvae]UHH17816.1 hypothetical protein LUV23_16635 [Streptomyces sp. HNM0561]